MGNLSSGDSERKKEIVDLTLPTPRLRCGHIVPKREQSTSRNSVPSAILPSDQGEALAPKLAGSGAKGAEYLVENIIDPNAVIGRDYQAKIFVTDEVA